MILHRPADRLGRFTRFTLILAIVAPLGESLALAEDNSSDSQSPSAKRSTQTNSPDTKREYFVTGQLTDAKTGEPIVGSNVRVLVTSERQSVGWDGEIQRTCLTDQTGTYRIAVPVGDAMIFYPELPPGYYWPDYTNAIERFKTTVAEPVTHIDLTARKGPVMMVQVAPPAVEVSLKALVARVDAVKPKRDRAAGWSSISADIGEDRRGQIVVPPGGTDYTLSVFQRNPYVKEEVTIHCEEDFRLDNPTEISESDDRTVTDQQGRTLRVSAGTLSIHGGQLTITVEIEPNALPTRMVVGRVVNVHGEPISGVHIGIWRDNVGGVVSLGLAEDVTSAEGRFELAVELDPQFTANQKEELGQQIGLTLNKDGFAFHDTGSKSLGSGETPIDFGAITLRSGHSAIIHVLGPGGTPVVGATVTPSNGFAASRLITRTDETGTAVFDSLPLGSQRLRVQWGNYYAQAHLFVTKTTNAEIEVHLKLPPQITNREQSSTLKNVPIKVGAQAPELTITGWSDGQKRALSKYRGKNVVLDFWGIWCSACRFSMPAKKRIATKFADDDVVFLGIHTAGDDMS